VPLLLRLNTAIATLILLGSACTGAHGEGILQALPNEMDGVAVRDTEHKNAPAVEVWMGQAASADFGTVPPGRYRVTLRGRFLGERSVRYAMNLTATVGGTPVGGKALRANIRPTDGKYHDLSAEFTVLKQGSVSISLNYRDTVLEEDAKILKERSLAGMDQPAAEDALKEKEDIEAELEELPRPKGSHSFLLSKMSVERLPLPLLVTRIWPDKIHYYPEEKAKAEIDVTSVSEVPSKGTLVVNLVREIDQVKELLREPVELGPGGKVTKTLAVDTGEEYGYEIQVTVTADGQTKSHSLSEYFSVSSNLFEVALQGWGRVGVLNDQESMRKLLTMPQEELEALATNGALGARRRYYNMIEYFSWAPDDFFNLSPKKDVWWSGTMTYIKVKRDIMTDIRALQTHGIKVLSYAQPFAAGIDTVKELRINPEFFAYYGNGAPAVSYDYDLIKSQARTDMGLRPKGFGGGLNFFSLKTVDRGIDAIVASRKMFGWDGVRFDNRYYRANNPITWTGERATTEKDLDPYSARNVKHMKQRFWKEIHPRWLISHNNGFRFRHKGNILGWEETVKDGLMCMDEETESAVHGNHHLNEWVKYMQFAVKARRFCTKLGGYYQLFPPGRASVSTGDMLHYVVACAASGSHPITCDNEGSPAGRYGRFFTRYSAMMFARDIVRLEEPEKILSFPDVDDGRLWWKDFASRRRAGDKQWLLFPLVVAPKIARINHNQASVIPEGLDGLTARLATDSVPGKPRAFLLSAEPGPMSLELEVKTEGGVYTMSLPRIAHFGLLVIEGDAK